MLSLILTILKMIGMILVVLLLILVVLIAAVLWIPFRYKVKASKQDEIHAAVRLSWMLHFIHIVILYEEKKLGFVIRILGIPIYDSERPKKVKKPKKAKKKKIVTKTSKTKNVSDPTVLEEKKAETDSKETVLLPIRESEDDEKKVTDEAVKPSNQKGGMKSRIKQIINTILSIPKKIKEFFIGIRKTMVKLIGAVQKIMAYPGKIKEFLKDEKNKSAISMIWQTIRRLVKHVSPRRVKGEIIFGFDDPCTTGQVLGGASVAYAYLGLKYVRFIPDFEKARSEGWLEVRGRVYSFTVLRIVIRLILDKNFKVLKDRISQLKEE